MCVTLLKATNFLMSDWSVVRILAVREPNNQNQIE